MIIFMDMDGVLADFNGRVAKLLNSTVEEMVIPGKYSSVAGLGLSENDMWNAIDKDSQFFEKLEPYPWVDMLMRTMEDRVGEENVALLTSPAKGAEPAARCAAGKIRWIYKYLPRYYRRYFIGSNKPMLAHPGAVLIDDSDKKVNNFVKAGGHGILFPARWNSDHQMAALGKQLSTVTSRLNFILGQRGSGTTTSATPYG